MEEPAPNLQRYDLQRYSRLLELSGRPVIKLSEDEAAVYIGFDFTTVNRTAMLNGILTEQRLHLHLI